MEPSASDRALIITKDRRPDGTTRLHVAGELDAHSAPEFVDAFEDVADGAAVELDLTEVSFLDSSGLAAVLEARRQLDSSGGSLVVTAASSAVARLLELTGVSEHLMRANP